MSMYQIDDLTKQLGEKRLSLCGCIGAINGQPHCPCKMARLARLAKEKQVLVDAVGSEKCQINLPNSKL